MKVCVVGCGYIGLPTVAMFASNGCDVIAVDQRQDVVDALNQGRVEIEEPGLQEIIKQVSQSGHLHASTQPDYADVFIVSVPTPNLPDEYRSCDLSFVMAAVDSIIPYLQSGNTVIIESTIAPRSMDDHIAPRFTEAGFQIGDDLFLAHCPERVLPGNILYELTVNDRIVGGMTPKCCDKVADVYRIFVKGEIVKTQAKTAEMSKCMENTFRDVNIALANELARICDRLEIDCLDVIRMANKHPRVNLLAPGPGVGGHCLAVDPYFISAAAPDTARIIQLARETNSAMPQFVADKVDAILQHDKSKVIAALGVAYKGNTDDTRESPALEVISRLSEAGYHVLVVDDHVRGKDFLSLDQAIPQSDIAVVLTDHDDYKGDALHPILRQMRTPLVFDTRNIVADCSGVQRLTFGTLWQARQ